MTTDPAPARTMSPAEALSALWRLLHRNRNSARYTVTRNRPPSTDRLRHVFDREPQTPTLACRVQVAVGMSTEYGVFSDEGLVEGGFYSKTEANDALRLRYEADDDLHVSECCHDHPEHEADTCELCNLDEEVREDLEDDDDEA